MMLLVCRDELLDILPKLADNARQFLVRHVTIDVYEITVLDEDIEFLTSIAEGY